MTTRRRRQFVYQQTLWMLATILVFGTFGLLTLERFFVVSLVGFLLLVEATATVEVDSPWRSRLRWLIVAGIVAFAYVAVRRLLDIVSTVIN
jgi:hypothetical protein